MKLRVISLIEIINGLVVQPTSWVIKETDVTSALPKIEKYFKNILKKRENPPSKKEIDISWGLENYNDNNGYELIYRESYVENTK